MARADIDPAIRLLLDLLDEAYDRQSWHGPNLRGSLRRLTLREVSWRPAPERHSIWENVVHAAYWKYTVRRRLRGEKRGSFPLKGSNWFPRPQEVTESAWRADLGLLREMHGSLRSAVAELDPGDLGKAPAGSKVSNSALIRGVAAHDVYHAGQIQLLKRLARGAAGGQRG
jgi:hypothetical protein